MFQNIIERHRDVIISVALTLIIGLIAIKMILKVLKKTLKKFNDNVAIHVFIQSLTKVVLLIILVVMLLNKMQVETSSMIAILSVAGLAVSLAIQGSLANIAGGVVLLFTKPFEVNNYIQIDSVEGNVKHINILTTKLSTVDNKIIYIPNSHIVESTIINFSEASYRLLEMEISISYEDDFNKAKHLLHQLVTEHPMTRPEPAPLVRVCDLASSAVKIRIRVWVENQHFWTLKFDLLEQIKLCFDENELHFPFEQLEITHRRPPA